MKARSLAAALLAVAPALLADPTSTPTPAPKLTGGFGKAPSTPAASGRGTSGQSLQDVVRAASQARQGKETPKPAVAITNETLVTDPKRGRLTTLQGAPTPAPQPTASSPSAAPVAGTPPAAAADPAATEEAKWHARAQNARQRVEDGKTRVARLEGETRKLENDFYAWDDGQYRDNVIKPAWDRKREELETARRDLEEAEKDLADLPEQARKAGALPGWIRE